MDFDRLLATRWFTLKIVNSNGSYLCRYYCGAAKDTVCFDTKFIPSRIIAGEPLNLEKLENCPDNVRNVELFFFLLDILEF